MKAIAKKFALLTASIMLTISLYAGPALAQTRAPIIPPGAGEETLILPTGSASGSDTLSGEIQFGGVLLPRITQTVIAITGALSLLFVIIGAVQILTAYGNEERIQAGKKSVIFAIAGLLIAMLSYAIVSIVSSINLEGSQETTGTQTEQGEGSGSESESS